MIPATIGLFALYDALNNAYVDDLVTKVLDKEVNTQRLKSSIKRVLNERGLEGCIISKDGNFSSIDAVADVEDLPIDFWLNTTIVRSDSQFMDRFYRDLSEKNAKFVKRHVKYIVFSPDVVDRLSNRVGKGELNGYSTGYGLIFVDTQASTGTIKNPLGYLCTIGHEARHEADIDKEYCRLVLERRAYQRQFNFLNDQIQNYGDDPYLIAKVGIVKRRIEVAKFLEGFGSDFSRVIHTEIMTARSFLQANIPEEVLAKYIDIEPESEFHEHLRASCKMAHTALKLPRNKAIERLYAVVESPSSANTYLQFTAATALHYLAAVAMVKQYGGNITDLNGFHSYYGVRSRTNGVGQVIAVKPGYSVSGIPPMKDLLKNDRPAKKAA